MASLWGGPPGLKTVVPPIKANAGFLEKLVLDPAEAKESVPLDLLAHANRRLHAGRDPEAAMTALVRALEALPDMSKDKYVFLRADVIVPYGELMGVMEILRAGGYSKVKLVALEGVPGSAAAAPAAEAAKP